MSVLQRIWYGEGRPTLSDTLAVVPLSLLGVAYSAGARLNGALFDRGVRKSQRIEGVRVISVGNLTVGGAGKTPAVLYLARRLTDEGHRVAVLSRGYGRRTRSERRVSDGDTAAEVGDEPLLIHRRAKVPVYVGSERVALAERARADGAQTLILDDGFQHRRLARDLDILVVNGPSGFGNGRLLPRGPLREPVEAIRRASLIWFRGEPTSPLPEGCGGKPIIHVRHVPSSWTRMDGQVFPAAKLSGERVFAFAGIANPGGFVESLVRLGAEVVGAAAFPDHHAFKDGELASLEAHAKAAGASLITTEKDAVRLPPNAPVSVLAQDVELLSGAEVLTSLLPPCKKAPV